MSRGRRAIGARVPVIAAVLALLLLLPACADDGEESPSLTTDDSRPLTTEEAELLALTRFRNFDAGVREVSFAVTDAGARYEVDAWIDFPAGAGYGTVAVPAREESVTLAWTNQGVATGGPSPPGEAPLPPQQGSWTSSALAPEQSRLHAVLAVLLALGNDRPDNPVLLAQTDAQWVREDSVGGTDVTVFRGPSSDTAVGTTTDDADGTGATAELHYWVGADSTLHRLELDLAGGGEPVVVDLADAPGVAFDLTQLDGPS